MGKLISFYIPAALTLLFACGQVVQAQVAVGPHVAVNLDNGDLHLGADLVVDLVDVSPSVKLAVWPSYGHIFVDDAADGDLFCVDFPFVFAIADSIVSPYVGPGLGLSIFDDVKLRFNVIGGVFFEADPVRPFSEIAFRFINGLDVDLVLGVLFEL